MARRLCSGCRDESRILAFEVENHQVQEGHRFVLKLAAFATVAGCGAVPLLTDPTSDVERKAAMRSRPLMTLRLTTAPIQNVGAVPRGTRVTFPIVGGSFEGDRLRGKVLPGGDD